MERVRVGPAQLHRVSQEDDDGVRWGLVQTDQREMMMTLCEEQVRDRVPGSHAQAAHRNQEYRPYRWWSGF